MKKKIIILLVFIFALIIILIPKHEKITKKEITKYKNQTEQKLETITSENVTFDEFKKIIGKNITNVHITVGQNSYLRNRPSLKLIEKYDLDEYVKKEELYASEIEKRYLNSLEYRVVKSNVKNNKVCQDIEIKTYYYSLYLIDLINLTNTIAEGDIENTSTDEKTEVEYFKAQVDSEEILSNYLDDYENKTNEKTSASICYKNGKIEKEDQMLSLAVALQGETYSNCDFSNEEVQKKANERLQKYLNDYNKK